MLGSAGTGVQLEAIETPGHTPESLCVLVREGTDPKALLSGDTLFIGDVGRPDLLVSRGSSAASCAIRPARWVSDSPMPTMPPQHTCRSA